MSDNYRATEEFLWNRINELFAETNRLKTELKQVTKERDEYSARWENLNKEVEKKFTYKASRTYSPSAFAERLDMTIKFDPDLYRASKIDMVHGLVQEVYDALSYELEKRFTKK
jgi:predicted nuclease with TOPRIM domain